MGPEIAVQTNKAMNHLSNEMKKNSGKGYVNRETVLEMISDKVDKIELLSLLEHKANKNDMETNMDSVEVIHRHVQNIITIILELLVLVSDNNQ